MQKLKVYLSPERRQAPHGKYWGIDAYETDICTDIAKLTSQHLTRCGFDVVIAPAGLDIRTRSAWANENGVNYYLPIHTNASTNGTCEGAATGCEMLCHPSVASRKACQLIYEELTRLYPSKRGVRDGGNYIENHMTDMVSAYCEVAFHDNGADAQFLVSSKGAIAKALAKGVCGYFAVEFVEGDTTEIDWERRYKELVKAIEGLIDKEMREF